MPVVCEERDPALDGGTDCPNARLPAARVEKRTMAAIPGVTLHQRLAPTAACHVTYEPSATVVAQGRKEVQIGRNTLTYDSSRYLLTSVALPTVTRVSEAS